MSAVSNAGSLSDLPIEYGAQRLPSRPIFTRNVGFVKYTIVQRFLKSSKLGIVPVERQVSGASRNCSALFLPVGMTFVRNHSNSYVYVFFFCRWRTFCPRQLNSRQRPCRSEVDIASRLPVTQGKRRNSRPPTRDDCSRYINTICGVKF
jgi:hypothetical protein